MAKTKKVRGRRQRQAVQIACAFCGTLRGVRKIVRLCAKCQAENRPTPLQRWRAQQEMSIGDLAERAGLERGTVRKADAGNPVALRTALRLHAATKIPVETFLGDEPHG